MKICSICGQNGHVSEDTISGHLCEYTFWCSHCSYYYSFAYGAYSEYIAGWEWRWSYNSSNEDEIERRREQKAVIEAFLANGLVVMPAEENETFEEFLARLKGRLVLPIQWQTIGF